MTAVANENFRCCIPVSGSTKPRSWGQGKRRSSVITNCCMGKAERLLCPLVTQGMRRMMPLGVTFFKIPVSPQNSTLKYLRHVPSHKHTISTFIIASCRYFLRQNTARSECTVRRIQRGPHGRYSGNRDHKKNHCHGKVYVLPTLSTSPPR